ncbi:MAG: hypothetical protein WDO19_07220 [Bacteroidota bacterium]
MQENGKNTVQKTINIYATGKAFMERISAWEMKKALNQLIAHHSIVFEPQKLLVWFQHNPGNWRIRGV